MSSSDGTKSNGPLQSIVVAVVIALLVGGSGPWWWSKVFPGHGTKDTIPYMGPLEGGTNRGGSDLSRVGIQANSAAECADLCAANDSCKAMTFVKHPDANGGICWLKGSVPSPNADQGMVSAVKLYRTQ